MQEQDGLEGLFLDLDLTETAAAADASGRGSGSGSAQDRKAARMQAVFERARHEYTPKIDTAAWFLPHPITADADADAEAWQVPSPTQLAAQRKLGKRGSYEQEWTLNYLYANGHIRACLAYAVSFCHSMHIPLPLDLTLRSPQDAVPITSAHAHAYAENQNQNQHAVVQLEQVKRVTRADKKVQTNWGQAREVLDAAMRCICTIGDLESTVRTWIPTSSSTYEIAEVSLRQLALALVAFCSREVRVGAGDQQHGYAAMAVHTPQPDGDGRWQTNPDLLRTQNWSIIPGLALTLGDLCTRLEFHRGAIEAYALFLAARGLHWRSLLALARALAHFNPPNQRQILDTLSRAAVVLAIQNTPRRRKQEVAASILAGNVVPLTLSISSLSPDHILQSLLDANTFSHEVTLALLAVIFAKKGDLVQLANKFDPYLQQYTSRGTDQLNHHEDDDDADQAAGPRSVRTL